MSKLKVPALLQQAEQLHKAGDLAAMEAACREILTIRQDVPKVWQLLGTAARAAGRREEAVEMYQKALTYFPDSVNVLSELSLALLDQGALDAAWPHIEKLRKLQPNSAETALAYGKYLIHHKRLKEAEAELQRAIRLNPKLPEAHLRLGNALRDQGELGEALAAFRRAIQLNPHYADAFVNYGALLWSLGEAEEAIAQYRRAIEINPNFFQARNNLGVALSDLGRFDEALAQFQACLQIQPQHAKAHSNFANALAQVGSLDEAIKEYERAVECAPGNPTFLSNAATVLNYHPASDAAQRLAAARRWGERLADPFLGQSPSFANDRNPTRRLRIGYLTPDFANPEFASFLIPLLAHHRAEEVELFGYSNVAVKEPLPTVLKPLGPTFRTISQLEDEQIAARIREDQIDILVDLALHSVGNRLAVFARKPAPIQISYLAYVGTTGLKQIDYRLTDRFLDPPERPDDCYSEQSLRFPDASWCYDPLFAPPPVGPAPCAARGYVTFGNLSASMKVNNQLVSLWAAVLKAVAKSRMVVRADAPLQQQRLAAWFAKHGISRDRVDFVAGGAPPEIMKRYAQIDIALDTFPCSELLGSCAAYLMGVPVISLCGKDAISRVGLSLAAQLGLAELLVGTSPVQFVEKAGALAGSLEKLTQLRQQLRPKMAQSPLMNAARFTQNLERLYRQVWQRWCRKA